MKLKLSFKNKIITEIIVKPNGNENYASLPHALSKFIINYTKHLRSCYTYLVDSTFGAYYDLRFSFLSPPYCAMFTADMCEMAKAVNFIITRLAKTFAGRKRKSLIRNYRTTRNIQTDQNVALLML